MTVITMSRNELTRLQVLIDVADWTPVGCRRDRIFIGVGRRQIYRRDVVPCLDFEGETV